MTQSELKTLVGKTAIDTLIEEGKIFSGMKIGLGTGSTAIPAVKRLASRIADGTLKDIKAVPTSFQTQICCEELGIPVYSMNDKVINGHLDLTIDGADEICSVLENGTYRNTLIKGGGAALLREKIVAYNSTYYAIVADESKKVANHGTKFPLPVEVIGEARIPVQNELEKLGAKCTLREGVKKCGPVITDNGNMILDCVWEQPVDPVKMEETINKIVGVVEVGFFTKLNPTAFISNSNGTVERY